MKERDLYHIDKILSDHLHSWYLSNKRDLPWRKTKDPYKIWISEIMLQQTQVTTVIDYYERWLKIFPDVKSLASGNIDDVLKLWEGLGYYSRAINLHKGALFVITKFKGIIPEFFKDLISIPGIGPYTAAAIASIAFEKTEGVIDGNVKRVLSRLFEIFDPVSSSNYHKIGKLLIEESFHGHSPSDMNQAWMELGALICQPKPHCQPCPIKKYCLAYNHNTMKDFPVKIRKSAIPLREGGIFIFQKDNKYLIVRRNSEPQQKAAKGKSMLRGLWELPNTYYDEAPLADFTLANDIIIDSSYIKKIKHAYSHFKVEFECYAAHLRSEWWNDYWHEARWVEKNELLSLPRTKVMIKALKIIGIIE